MHYIYLDFNASTPICKDAVEAMRPFLDEHFGNPSSRHWAGTPAKEAVEKARSEVAGLIGCDPSEIVFTSGGTESNNHAIKGVFFANRHARPHIVTSRIEHPAVINPCRFLEALGAEVTFLPVDSFGIVDPDDVRRAITARTILVSVMHANNETGTIQPIREISRITRECGVVFHSDAAQSAGKIDTFVDELGVDLLSIAGHKLYAPKGVGALYVRKGTDIEPFMHGAGHESGRRAGTENVLLIAGLGAACRVARQSGAMRQVKDLRDRLWNRLRTDLCESVVLNGHPDLRLPNTLNVSFPGLLGADILASLDGVAASTGSACHEGLHQMSPVLREMGLPPRIGLGAVRFSLGRTTTAEEIDEVADRITSKIRA